MVSIAHIVFIIKTGLATLVLVAGIWLLIISREKWENLVGGLLDISDLEISTPGFVTIKVFGVIFIAIGSGMAYLFFIH